MSNDLDKMSVGHMTRYLRKKTSMFLDCAIYAMLDTHQVEEVVERLRDEADHLQEFVRGSGAIQSTKTNNSNKKDQGGG